MPLRYRDHKQTAENQSQQSPQKINGKYFLNTFSSETMKTDLFFLREQYFESQE